MLDTTTTPELAREVAVEKPAATLIDQAELQLRWLSDCTGLPWFAGCARSGRWLATSTSNLPPLHCVDVPPSTDSVVVRSLADGLLWYQFLPSADRTTPIRYCGYVTNGAPLSQAAWMHATQTSGWSTARRSAALAEVPVCSQAILERVLRSAASQWELREQSAASQQRRQSVTQAVSIPDRDLGLLRELLEQLGPTSTVAELAAICLPRLNELLPAEAHLLWIRGPRGQGASHRRGQVRFPDARLVAYLEAKSPAQPLFSRTPPPAWGIDPQQLRQFAAVPIGRGFGWLITCNLRASALLPAQAELLKSLAAILAVPMQQGQLQLENEELALGIVHSLVNTLDAKDPHTRGHSERVARIARRLGRQMYLSAKELDDIYLAGMLHDIGKIGINDTILQKTDPLSPEEFREIQRHPVIGYEMLAPIRRLKPILPGVRHHHESYNGRGYPDGLCGEAIPLMARIIAVADGFDAMISDRPYRPGMPLERVETIFRRGAGEQWDAKVIQAYFHVRDEIVTIRTAEKHSGEIRVPEWVLAEDGFVEPHELTNASR